MDRQRVRKLKEGIPGEGPVAYWMSRDQRAQDNWALLFAQSLAQDLNRQVVVVFCLAHHFLEAQDKHFVFMLQGLKETEKNLAQKNIPLVLLEGDPVQQLKDFLNSKHIGVLVTDFSPLRIKRTWNERIIKGLPVPFYEVDAHNIVPCWQASPKQEYAAYTLRPKINKKKERFLTDFIPLAKQKLPAGFRPLAADWQKLVQKRGLGKHLLKDFAQKPGQKEAFGAMETFFEHKLTHYDRHKNDPNRKATSNLSPYIHFGQIAAQRIALEALQFEPGSGQQAFLEELMVRRELADNFCHYNGHYDQFRGFPHWARQTLKDHRGDRRAYLYSLRQLQQGQTHDPVWNAAQDEMRITGKMHGYMRMYWAKKILEWTQSPQQALAFATTLNDRYQLDGRDPNGYAGIAWSIGGVHDRAFKERDVFGKIRYMSLQGLERKFDTAGYIAKINGLKNKT